MKKILCVLTFIFLLSGCGGNDLKCTRESVNSQYDDSSTITVTYKDGLIEKIKTKNVYDHATEDEAIKEEENFKDSASYYEEIEGMTYTVKRNKKKVTVETTATISKLSEETIDFFFDGNIDLSEEEYQTLLEENGYTCK